jgi:hypothetical protein
MLLNLSKDFHFNLNSKEYHVGYLFTRPESSEKDNVCLTLNVSINNKAEEIHQLVKPTSVLYQSNEAIEKMIETELTTTR